MTQCLTISSDAVGYCAFNSWISVMYCMLSVISLGAGGGAAAGVGVDEDIPAGPEASKFAPLSASFAHGQRT